MGCASGYPQMRYEAKMLSPGHKCCKKTHVLGLRLSYVSLKRNEVNLLSDADRNTVPVVLAEGLLTITL